MNKFAIIAAVLALVVGLAAGFFLGRFTLERQWRQPQMILEQSKHDKLAQADADPVPPTGTQILKPMPLERSRQAMKEFTKNDALTARVTSFGNGEDGAELHVDVENKGKCTVTSFAGVAYAFDAFGVPAKANKSGENFVAFSEEKVEVAPDDHHLVAQKLKYPETASLAVAQVDSYTCKDGPGWKRPVKN